MPGPYPAELRARAVALVRAGKTITTTAAELGISQSCLHNWICQDLVNRGELPGVTTSESVELRRARKRIRQLELEVEILHLVGVHEQDPLLRDDALVRFGR